jgi:hypothetical protein
MKPNILPTSRIWIKASADIDQRAYLSLYQQLSTHGRVDASECTQQRSLTRTVVANESHALTAPDAEIQVAER